MLQCKMFRKFSLHFTIQDQAIQKMLHKLCHFGGLVVRSGQSQHFTTLISFTVGNLTEENLLVGVVTNVVATMND